MKKSFYAIIAAFVTIVSLSTSCNESTQKRGCWVCGYCEVDELTNSGGYYYNDFYMANGEYFSCVGEAITIHTNNEIYGYYRDRRYDYDLLNDVYATVIVGFYEDKKLKEKVTKEFYIGFDGLHSVTLVDEELSKKILSHLKDVGNVRIILEGRYGCITDITLSMSKKIII